MIKKIFKIFLFCLVSVGFLLGMQEIPQEAMEVIYVDSEETAAEDGSAANVLDGDKETIWHTEWSGDTNPGYPHEIIFKLDQEYKIENFSYWPRQSSANGRIKTFEFYVTNDTSDWGEPVLSGNWENENNKQTEELTSPVTAQFVRLVALSEVNDNIWASAAEINLNDSFDPSEDLDGWASSLHLTFRDDNNHDSQLLMVDIKVDSSSSNTYYAPINFTGGYCGIQDVNDSKRTLHFSLWDYVDGDQQSVPEGAEARILWRGYRVEGSSFGNEGTGIKTWKNYQWKNNQPYRLVVKMRPAVIDSFPGATRDYWVYDFETREWMHIATLWRADNPDTGEPETNLGEVHVFVEDWAATSELHRSCYVYNALKQYRGGTYHTYDHAFYSINDDENNPATSDGHDPNTQAEVRDDDKIWLMTGGDFIPENRTPSGTTLHFSPNPALTPERPTLTDIDYTIENDSTVKVTWGYEDSKWAAQESFDLRFYADENMDELIYKTGDLYPHDYESSEWKKGSDRRYTVNRLQFDDDQTYYLRIVTKTIFGKNCWNSEPIVIAKTNSSEENKQLPQTLKLQQNFPNPFNPTTTIAYQLPATQHIDLSVFDLQGNRIKTLYKGIQQQGNYTTIWTGRNNQNRKAPTGVYLLILQSEKNRLEQKMILLK